MCSRLKKDVSRGLLEYKIFSVRIRDFDKYVT